MDFISQVRTLSVLFMGGDANRSVGLFALVCDGLRQVNEPIEGEIFPRVGTPLHLNLMGLDVWFGKVIISCGTGCFTGVCYSKEEMQVAVNELLKKVQKVKK